MSHNISFASASSGNNQEEKKQEDTKTAFVHPSCARYSSSRYLEEPKFELDGKFDYGDYGKGKKAPGNRHFIPRRAKLKAAGGKSISLYEKWRLMQYNSNCIMKKFLDRHRVNVSVLPPCVNYDLWKYPKWKAMYDKPLDEDPCPDCDVRFVSTQNGQYKPKIAPASILQTSRWNVRKYLDSIILIGLPQHITVAYIKETSSQVFVEYVDPAGPSGDKRGCEEVQLWMHTYMSPLLRKPIKFYQAAKGINFQSDKNDVMCQTWIWYWVYFRLVRLVSCEVVSRHIYRLSHDKKSLERVHKFNCWLSDLHKLGFYTEASVSQTQVAEESTPRKPNAAMPAARAEKKQGRVQGALKKIMKKTTSEACFSKSHANSDYEENTEDDSTTDTEPMELESCDSADMISASKGSNFNENKQQLRLAASQLNFKISLEDGSDAMNVE